MARVYLETSFVSALVTNRQDTASAYRRQVTRRWWTSQRHRHELFVSQEVVEELSDSEFRHREAAVAFVEAVPRLGMSEEVRGLAKILVREKVMPAPATGEAIHVAVATVHGVDCMLTWNVRHLANMNKVRHLRIVCSRVGYVPPEILTPDLLWEYNE